MGGNPNATFEKRRKEMKRKQKQKEKSEKQLVRKEEKSKVGSHPAGEDPDLAGLVPGPNQPPPEEA